MSHQEPKHPNSPKSNPPERFQPKVIFIWAAIILLMIFLYVASDPTKAGNKIPIAEVVKAAEENRLMSVTIKSAPDGGIEWYKISGEMLPPAKSVEAAAVAVAVAVAENAETENSAKPTTEAQNKLPFFAEGRLTEERYNLLTAPDATYKVEEQPAGGNLHIPLLMTKDRK